MTDNNKDIFYMEQDLNDLLKEVSPEKKERVKGLIERDPLTSVYNKKAFRARMEDNMALAIRAGSGIAVLMMDLDGFKQYNESAGHIQADKVLVDIVNEIQKTLRIGEKDNLARFGGDEFLFYCTADNINVGYSVAERARKAVAQKFKKDYLITLSIGVAFYQPKQGPKSVESLLQEANDAMRLVKQEGKDGVETYNPKT